MLYYKQGFIFKKSKNPNKKYDAILDNRTISFGASGYPDFTQDIKTKRQLYKTTCKRRLDKKQSRKCSVYAHMDFVE
jgi:hypothetical protein